MNFIAALDAGELACVFLALMGLAVLVYAVLDGFDLGVGILLPLEQGDALQRDRNQMIASIGPFWDANETWLVLAVGLLLIAFPDAYSLVLRELYLPAVLLLIGLILRGVSFDFRAKAVTEFRPLWDRLFKFGSVLTALMLGYMLGRYILGFEQSVAAQGFAILSSFCVAAAFAFIGGSWLVMKTEGELQLRAARWSRRALSLTAVGLVSVSVANLLLSDAIAQRWFDFPIALFMLPIPVATAFLIFWVDRRLRAVPQLGNVGCSQAFYGAVGIFVLAFAGLGLSHFPYVVPTHILATEAASDPASLRFVLYGTIVVLPVIIAYTAFSYRVFWGKTTELKYH